MTAAAALVELLDACPLARAARGGRGIRARHCVWCDAALTGRQRRWCSQRCVHAHRSNHTWSVARQAALDRDGHQCMRCGWRPSTAAGPWQAVDEPHEAFLARERRWQADHPPLQVNHITPCLGQHAALSCAHHLDNLETLCPRCHRAATARQFGQPADPPGQGRLWAWEQAVAVAGAAGTGLPLELPPVVTPIPAVERLLAAVAAGTAGATCNFYAASPDSPDPDGVAAVRRERLRRFLTARWAAPVVLVGEAAGWRGARRSGIPLTSEHQVLGHGMREATATIVHQVLTELGAERQVLLWNVVPYHPHRPGLPDSNRPPTAGEIRACQELLAAVVADRAAIAVGRTAAAALQRLGVDQAGCVRHPSHGGRAAFAAGLAAALGGRGSGGGRCR